MERLKVDKDKKDVKPIVAAVAWPLLCTQMFSFEEALVLASRNCHLEDDLHLERETHMAQAASTEGPSRRLRVVSVRQ